MISKSLMAASTKPLILTILKRKESYGYEIIQQVKDLTGGSLEWADGMLYPVLHRLENEKLISSRWLISDEGRKRKYYSLTVKGKQELQGEQQQWIEIHNVLARLWNLKLITG